MIDCLGIKNGLSLSVYYGWQLQAQFVVYCYNIDREEYKY